MELNLNCVLDFCNEVRTDLGRKPVARLRRGKRHDLRVCPVANTINYQARNRVEVCECCGVNSPSHGYSRDATECVVTFIRHFDNGELPAFEGDGWA